MALPEPTAAGRNRLASQVALAEAIRGATATYASGLDPHDFLLVGGRHEQIGPSQVVAMKAGEQRNLLRAWFTDLQAMLLLFRVLHDPADRIILEPSPLKSFAEPISVSFAAVHRDRRSGRVPCLLVPPWINDGVGWTDASPAVDRAAMPRAVWLGAQAMGAAYQSRTVRILRGMRDGSQRYFSVPVSSEGRQLAQRFAAEFWSRFVSGHEAPCVLDPDLGYWGDAPSHGNAMPFALPATPAQTSAIMQLRQAMEARERLDATVSRLADSLRAELPGGGMFVDPMDHRALCSVSSVPRLKNRDELLSTMLSLAQSGTNLPTYVWTTEHQHVEPFPDRRSLEAGACQFDSEPAAGADRLA